MKTGTAIIIGMLLFGILSAFVVLKPKDDHSAEKESIRTEISAYDAKKMYPQAVSKYQELIKLDNENYDLAVEYKNYCRDHEFEEQYAAACEQALSLNAGDFATAQEYLEYLNANKSEKVYSFCHNMIKQFDGDEKAYFEDYYNQIKGNYEVLSRNYNDVSDWHSNTIYYVVDGGYIVVSGDEYYAFAQDKNGEGVVVDNNGKTLFSAEEILSYTPQNNIVSAHHEEQLVYLNSSGQRAIVPYENGELIYYDYLSAFSNGLAAYNKGGSWGYINTSGAAVVSDYEGVTPFANNVAAMKSGGKWAFVKYTQKDGITNITGFDYDDILLDEYGYPFSNGYAYVKKSGSGQWSLVCVQLDDEHKSVTGVKDVGSLTFDDAKPFGLYGAVSQNGKWGFVNLKGEITIEPQFDDARSFEVGLAPVLVEDKWGYIDTAGNMIIEPQFEDAKAFNRDGVAAVKSGGKWSLIQLSEYAND